jgi:hypothetical protein
VGHPDLEGAVAPQPAAQLPGHGDASILPQAAAKLDRDAKVPQPAAQPATCSDVSRMPQLAAKLPWFHHVILIERVKKPCDRYEIPELQTVFAVGYKYVSS